MKQERGGSVSDSRFSGLPQRPGKIIAVHLSYGSRAEQRGRRPDAPSYFFKAPSSVAASGDSLGRPAGIELLGFEGEIALVIGTPAYRVGTDEAWGHVGWVTAANDFGMYDLRANDRGSNVRSKSGDGFTPIGPDLIPAAEIDPADLRVRTWVNGELIQDGHSSDLIFPLSQFVADLSQHFTLEVGDVILAGTPSGASVVQPGDVVEVEVDSPQAGASSGRLTTPIAEGHSGYDPTVGSMPAVDDKQRIDAWGSPSAAGVAQETS
ncbi:MAG TPA: fumarylacetoacetate hydrolase family protein, partial [Beutenbergiaceae bacterium]|nr:fumarylacetoacetate hydrolase family protein [Beutenbergiaceae bacterium]